MDPQNRRTMYGAGTDVSVYKDICADLIAVDGIPNVLDPLFWVADGHKRESLVRIWFSQMFFHTD